MVIGLILRSAICAMSIGQKNLGGEDRLVELLRALTILLNILGQF